jgi:predicted acylesterase/phospholipase RssA
MRAHLVLSSGGMKTLGYVGATQALLDHGVELATISACSAGIFFAAALATGVKPRKLRDFVLETDVRQFLGEPQPWLPGFTSALRWPRARFVRSGLGRAYVQLVGADPRFEELPIPLSTIALDLISSRILLYSSMTTPKMKVSEAIEIGAALPFLYPPHDTGSRLVVDGALASQCPIWLALIDPEDCPIVALAPSRATRHPRRQNVVEYLGTLVELGAVSRDLQLVDQAKRALLIELNTDDVEYDQFDLPRDVRLELISAGRRAVRMEHIDRIRSLGSGASSLPVTRRCVSPASEHSNDDLAELGGMRALARVNSIVSRSVRDQLFVSYASEGSGGAWARRLVDALKVRAETKNAAIWFDEQIQPGENWHDAIDNALARTKVALLLIDDAFFDSSYIGNVELPSFFRDAKSAGLTILWVLIDGDRWQPTALSALQRLLPRHPPLVSLRGADLERAFDDIAHQVALALE